MKILCFLLVPILLLFACSSDKKQKKPADEAMLDTLADKSNVSSGSSIDISTIDKYADSVMSVYNSMTQETLVRNESGDSYEFVTAYFSDDSQVLIIEQKGNTETTTDRYYFLKNDVLKLVRSVLKSYKNNNESVFESSAYFANLRLIILKENGHITSNEVLIKKQEELLKKNIQRFNHIIATNNFQ